MKSTQQLLNFALRLKLIAKRETDRVKFVPPQCPLQIQKNSFGDSSRFVFLLSFPHVAVEKDRKHTPINSLQEQLQISDNWAGRKATIPASHINVVCITPISIFPPHTQSSVQSRSALA